MLAHQEEHQLWFIEIYPASTIVISLYNNWDVCVKTPIKEEVNEIQYFCSSVDM